MIDALVRSLYAPLRAGDREALERLLHDDFAATFTAGLPFGVGGTKTGAEAIDAGWWTIGQHFAVRAEPAEYIACGDGRLLVTGVYTGRARASGQPFTADFAHLWAARDDGLVRLHQYTDSAAWVAAGGDA